jgi:glycosyltransferase involved in cell wall biosynthesis
MTAPDLFVVGRFPPPLDGQALATARLASLLAGPFAVGHADVGAKEGPHVRPTSPISPERLRFFLGARGRLGRTLAVAPAAPVLWPSISPGVLGHARDRLLVAPAFGRTRAVVGVVHRGDFASLFERPLTRASGHALVRRLSRIVFLTAGLADLCAAWVPDAKRAVVPNTLDAAAVPTPAEVAAARAARVARRGGGHPIHVLYLSGMIRSKGYLDVLDAVGALHSRGVPVRARFVGRWESDEAERVFHKRAAALGVGSVIEAAGGLSDRGAVRDAYLNADVFVLPTAFPFEAQPLTVLEAFAAGTPVVVTCHAGLPEMVDDGVEGRHVPARDPAAIAAAVVDLARPDAWTAASEAARARFERQFSPESVGQQWRALVRSLG